jgi:hypothetical protein
MPSAVGRDLYPTLATASLSSRPNIREGSATADIPRSKLKYSTKAGHLVGLLLPARHRSWFQGNRRRRRHLAALAHAASAGFRKPYEALFGRGRHPATGQKLRPSSKGRGGDGRPARVADLERELPSTWSSGWPTQSLPWMAALST